MQRIPKAIPAVQLGTTAAVLYTAPAGVTATINNLVVTNTGGGTVAVTLHRVPSGGTPSATNQLLSGFTLSNGQSYVPPQAIGLQLDPGMTLQGLAATAAVVSLMGGLYETSGS